MCIICLYSMVILSLCTILGLLLLYLFFIPQNRGEAHRQPLTPKRILRISKNFLKLPYYQQILLGPSTLVSLHCQHYQSNYLFKIFKIQA